LSSDKTSIWTIFSESVVWEKARGYGISRSTSSQASSHARIMFRAIFIILSRSGVRHFDGEGSLAELETVRMVIDR